MKAMSKSSEKIKKVMIFSPKAKKPLQPPLLEILLKALLRMLQLQPLYLQINDYLFIPL